MSYPANGAPLIRLSGVTKQWSSRAAVADVNLTLHKGESLALTGPNGSGKSTLLRLIGGILPLTSGKLEVLAPAALTFGFVPDRFPKLKFTSHDYLRHMGAIQGIPRPTLSARIAELHELFRFQPDVRSHMLHYSKGMLQKVNLMQALLTPPDVLLLDEPLEGLDRDTQEELLSVLLELRRQGVTIAAVTHEPEFAELLADRILTMEQGRIVQLIPNERAAKEAREAKRPHLVRVTCQGSTELLRRLRESHPALKAETISDSACCYLLERGRSDAFLMQALQLGVSIHSVVSDSDGRELLSPEPDSAAALLS